MKRNLAYLKYVLRHKWYVFLASRKLKVSLFRALLHDWHKFLPDEWRAYTHTFYDANGQTRYLQTSAFNLAWLRHQQRGKHHWQNWILTFDNGSAECLPMPEKYIREMIADWFGAGKAITGKWSAREWYAAQWQRMHLNPVTRERVVALLLEHKDSFPQ